MAIKYYLNQEKLEEFLEVMDEGFEANANTPINTVVIAKNSDNPSKSKKISSINLDSCIRQEVSENGVNFILNDLLNEVEIIYSLRGNVANEKGLQNIQNPEVNDVYKLNDVSLYAVWTGEEWEQFGILNNVVIHPEKNEFSAIPRKALDRVLYNFKPISVANLEELVAAINNDQEEAIISVSEDFALSSTVNIPEKKEITLNLNEHTLTASNMAFYVEHSKLTINNGKIISSNNDAISVFDKGSVIINDAEITSSNRNGISAKNGSIITLNSGKVFSQEAGLLGLKDSKIIVNGGIIESFDNGPIMGNGSAMGSTNDGTNLTIIMNGGLLKGHIQSAGYIACGVYVPNTGSFIMNGGEIQSDGCGVCMRGGKVVIGENAKISATGEAGVLGKVGDSRVVVGPYAIAYDANSRYPAYESLDLTINKGAQLSGTDGDIQVILAEGIDANITDNRN